MNILRSSEKRYLYAMWRNMLNSKVFIWHLPQAAEQQAEIVAPFFYVAIFQSITAAAY
jgi:hypothetical protein